MTDSWVPNDEDAGVTDHATNDAMRGTYKRRWDLDQIISRGYGLATVYTGDIDPDDCDDPHQNGVHALYPDDDTPADSRWSTIGAWSWGLSRALDYLEQDEHVDHKKIAVMGHSRLGKTALWAGVQDKRFALMISNNSGCGGAALSRRCVGETIGVITQRFPHWFCKAFNNYSNNEPALPVDQHMLIALAAPRPVYIASAEEDLWADPRGEFLSAYHAGPVYDLFGLERIPSDTMPAVHRPIMTSIGYHIRKGRHNVTPFDWTCFIDFADLHFKR
jgi:hypothetical protein